MKPKDLNIIETSSDSFNIIEGAKMPIKAWTKGVQVEDGALAQLGNVANLPFIYKHLAVMPDVHKGYGATVGSVVPTTGAIIPGAVGVDIGCGMMAVRTSLNASQLPDSLAKLRSDIEASVPHGRTDNGGVNDRGAWGDPPASVQAAWMGLEGKYDRITDKHHKVMLRRQNPWNHLGTLGTGNHFIEMCLDQEQRVWIMLHSGSRGVGAKIGSYFMDLAKEDMRKYFINLPDMELSYLPEGTDHFKDYVEAVGWAQDYARANREVMMENVLRALKKNKQIPKFDADLEAVNCHHNYVTQENHFGKNVWVTRKGAVNAREGVMGIIPGSMGHKSYIVRGLGNKESFCSCSHGAGRKMSRAQAKQSFTLKDHRKATEGVECRQDRDVIDETPGAYKNIEDVMEAQKDLVEVVHTLKQVLCVKG